MLIILEFKKIKKLKKKLKNKEVKNRTVSFKENLLQSPGKTLAHNSLFYFHMK